MLAGHYAASFAGKRAEPRVRLWVLLVAAQLVDIIWAVLVLTGVERASLDYSLPSNPLVAEYMPYTHSLLGAAVIAMVAALVVWRWLGSWRGGLVVGLVVVSHWFLDLPMHRPDLTLAGADPKLGWQLWNYPLLAHAVELGVLILCWLLLPNRRGGWAVILLLVLVVVQLYAILAPPPPSVTQMVLSLLVVYLAIAGLAAWLEPRSAAPG